ncbi:hypothetical protein Ahy_B04g072729 [Arachis hypogaea]|uniref:Uncharacterized protein n=1 Tax=Arachis hypogaea TaxID=3818 RepID=A0A444ZNU4_ARAHY|nr:hypothetical protein Ahy_B04g072729 [Arachis hypogaea]
MYGSPSSTLSSNFDYSSASQFNLLVNSETPRSSSASPLSETASVPNSVTKERLVPDGKTSWLSFPPGSQKITEIIKKGYDKPYKKFGDVPLPTKKLWFKEWKKKQLDRTPTHEEVFKETHTLKSDKSKWVDKRSQDTHVRYSINVKLMYILPLEYLYTHMHVCIYATRSAKLV